MLKLSSLAAAAAAAADVRSSSSADKEENKSPAVPVALNFAFRPAADDPSGTPAAADFVGGWASCPFAADCTSCEVSAAAPADDHSGDDAKAVATDALSRAVPAANDDAAAAAALLAAGNGTSVGVLVTREDEFAAIAAASAEVLSSNDGNGHSLIAADDPGLGPGGGIAPSGAAGNCQTLVALVDPAIGTMALSEVPPVSVHGEDNAAELATANVRAGAPDPDTIILALTAFPIKFNGPSTDNSVRPGVHSVAPHEEAGGVDCTAIAASAVAPDDALATAFFINTDRCPSAGTSSPAADAMRTRSLRFPVSGRDTSSTLRRHRQRSSGTKRPSGAQPFAEHVRQWVKRKVDAGVPEQHCLLPFLTGEPKAVECRSCNRVIYAGEEVSCSVSRCGGKFHRSCAEKEVGHPTGSSFKCPQHACVICKKKMFFWKCKRCTMAAHTQCAPWPVIHLKDEQCAICWRHSSNWLLENEHAEPTNDIEEAFQRLPIPFAVEEFKIPSFITDVADVDSKPPPYIHIRRNIYLIKRKRSVDDADVGCMNCGADSVCGNDCECRGLSVSCSKACNCSDLCTNKPFRKEKKIKVVKTTHCGWGVIALERIEKDDFIVEYIGEVIDDATCEQRLWDMKRRGDQNFYMCEISKDVTIDATYKGNLSRFLNHSCDPNCKLEKWHVDGETRVGVFASRSVEAGETLTYDYRFIQFGSKVKCYCGSWNCQGFIGVQSKCNQVTTDAEVSTAATEPPASDAKAVVPADDSSRPKPASIPLLPWSSCMELPFNLRSKHHISRVCWGNKRKRSSVAVVGSVSHEAGDDIS